MPRLRSLIVCLLLALWLPATLHCGIEDAGLLGKAEACANSCAADNCDVLESGSFKSTHVVVNAPAPALLISLCCLIEITPETIIVPLVSPERTDCPPEVACGWQFTVRAAPLPGAPSIAS